MRAFDPDALMRAASDAWTRWVSGLAYDGPQASLVRRAAITLKLLDYFANGSIVAAPRRPCPKPSGARATGTIGMSESATPRSRCTHCTGSVWASRAGRFLAWILDAVERHGHPRALYDLDGGIPTIGG